MIVSIFYNRTDIACVWLWRTRIFHHPHHLVRRLILTAYRVLRMVYRRYVLRSINLFAPLGSVRRRGARRAGSYA